MEIKSKTLKIPGLVQGKKDQDTSMLTEAEVDAVRKNFSDYIKNEREANKLGEMIANSASTTSSTWITQEEAQKQWGYVAPSPGTGVGGSNLGLIDPNIWGQGVPPFYQPTPDPFNGIYDKKTRIPQRQGTIGTQDWNDYISQITSPNKRSVIEELMDELFTTAEKEQFLIDAGYTLEHKSNLVISRKLADGTVKTITNTLEDLFLKEITIKFKNLLLAKSVLKLKL